MPHWTFFLGGRDLEMLTIGQLLKDVSVSFFDAGLGWGARASVYTKDIEATIAGQRTPVLIELEPDLPEDLLAECHLVDHHGPAAGGRQPTALEQVVDLLGIRSEVWCREFDLVAANDRGHIRAMKALDPPATDQQIRRIREGDLQAQGVSGDEFQDARQAAAVAETRCQDRLTVASTSGRTGLVAEMLEPFFGGPGFRNLLVSGQSESAFFGEGWLVERLAEASPGSPSSWFGGSLPDFGFWGAVTSELDFCPLSLLVLLLGDSGGAEAASEGTTASEG